MEDKRPFYCRVLDRLYDGIFECWDESGFYPERLDQPLNLQLLWAAQYAVGEVENGGFHQFFTNYSGVLAPESVLGLQLIGLNDCAVVVSRAMAYFGEPYPRSHAARLQKVPMYLHSAPDPFDDIDRELYDCLGEKNRFDDAADQFVRGFI